MVTKEMYKSKNNVTSTDYKVDRENAISSLNQTWLDNIKNFHVDIIDE